MNLNIKFLILALYQLERHLINQNFWEYLDLPKVSNPHGDNYSILHLEGVLQVI